VAHERWKKKNGVKGEGKGGKNTSKVCWACTSKGLFATKDPVLAAEDTVPGNTPLVFNTGPHQKGITACPFCKTAACKADMRYRKGATVPRGFPDKLRCHHP
jgi:hypothetical protein